MQRICVCGCRIDHLDASAIVDIVLRIPFDALLLSCAAFALPSFVDDAILVVFPVAVLPEVHLPD